MFVLLTEIIQFCSGVAVMFQYLMSRSFIYCHIRSFLQVFGFQLEESDMAALAGLHDDRHVTWDPTNVE